MPEGSQPRRPVQPDIRFRILNWVGMIQQLASTRGEKVLARHGLSLPQFIVLNHLSHRPQEPRTVTRIARALQQNQPAATKTIQKLLAKGLVAMETDPDDRRARLVRLTADGLDTHGAAVADFAPHAAEAFEGWSEAELGQFFGHLDRLKVWLDGHRDPEWE